MEQQMEALKQHHVKLAQQDITVQEEQIKQHVEQENIEHQLEEQQQVVVQHVQLEHTVQQQQVQDVQTVEMEHGVQEEVQEAHVQQEQ